MQAVLLFLQDECLKSDATKLLAYILAQIAVWEVWSNFVSFSVCMCVTDLF